MVAFGAIAQVVDVPLPLAELQAVFATGSHIYTPYSYLALWNAVIFVPDCYLGLLRPFSATFRLFWCFLTDCTSYKRRDQKA